MSNAENVTRARVISSVAANAAKHMLEGVTREESFERILKVFESAKVTAKVLDIKTSPKSEERTMGTIEDAFMLAWPVEVQGV